ncbi:MAG TPA: right-handed parallel beta-helix repeat-containing protein, partial [bacterium]
MLILAPGAWSETLVSGNVSGYWTVLGSPYIVVGSITVPANQFLTIQAGVEVRFQGDFNFLVLGGMCAWGNAVDSVKFIANVGQIPSSWKYIEYRDAWPDSARLRYCLIEAGDRAVYADGSEVLLEHCLIQKHAQAPVRGSSAQITLDNSTITNCGASGLSLDNTSAQVLNCDITDSYGATGHGITASNGSDITVNGGYIGNNIGWGIIGVSIGTVDLQNVEIAGNADGGVSLSFGTLFTASRAIIHDN